MKEHWDNISKHYKVNKENVWLYHVTYGKKKGLTVKIANGDLCSYTCRGPWERKEKPDDFCGTFFEYSTDPAYKYCGKVYVKNSDGTYRLDVVILNERDDKKACRELAIKYRDERDLIIKQYDTKIDAIYKAFDIETDMID